jgi:excisionase family DNA binding protein
MEALVVIPKSELIELIESAVAKCFKQPEPTNVKRPNYWSGTDTYDVAEAAEYLGLTVNYLQLLASKGQIPCSKPFKRLKFEKGDLDAWVKSKAAKRGDYSDVALTLAKAANRKLKKYKQTN